MCQPTCTSCLVARTKNVTLAHLNLVLNLIHESAAASSPQHNQAHNQAHVRNILNVTLVLLCIELNNEL